MWGSGGPHSCDASADHAVAFKQYGAGSQWRGPGIRGTHRIMARSGASVLECACLTAGTRNLKERGLVGAAGLMSKALNATGRPIFFSVRDS